ncbi:DUF3318 domain-containing protein [Pararobbsia alpina]|jgi:hypothetical protein|uniref:DUF3318 domain-containing protein n=1 Tax=Pararobbsia alpina TaxID=621374 RepID=A0A6S7BF02_9BURK|nr:DUF3318 domain-containing protein [Pararobbsia alpina]CAB3786510.1 hypothetical protein LMG28138_02238 [Pararobbsia alpina]
MNRPNDPREALALSSRRRGGTDRESRAIRKEILLLRSELERREIAEASAELRSRFAHFGWLKMLVPRFGARGGLAGFSHMLKDYPLVSSLASLALTHGPKMKSLKRLKPMLKFGAVAFAAWQAVKLWKAATGGDGSP